MFVLRTDYEKMFNNITFATKTYLNNNKNLISLVIGLSGGIDSTLTCALTYEVLKDFPHIKLIGRTLPIETNKIEEIDSGKKIGLNFCRQGKTYKNIYLTNAYKIFCKYLISEDRAVDDSKDEKIRKGNIKARIRMIYLFDLAHFEKGMVLSTDNYTEYLLGFWTLHGDVGNFGQIQYLWKTEVYGLAGFLVEKYKKEGDIEKSLALEESINAIPTDGLGITGSDFEQIGVSDYNFADKILIDYLKGKKELKEHPVIQRYRQTPFKRLDPQNISREDIIKNI